MASRECIAIFNAYAFDASVMLLAQVMGSSVAMVAAGELSSIVTAVPLSGTAAMPQDRLLSIRFNIMPVTRKILARVGG